MVDSKIKQWISHLPHDSACIYNLQIIFWVMDFPGGAIPGNNFFFLISFLSSLGPSPSFYFFSCLLHLGTWHLLCPLSVLEGVFSFHILMFPHAVFDLEIHAVTKSLVVLFCSHLTRCHLVSSSFIS